MPCLLISATTFVGCDLIVRAAMVDKDGIVLFVSVKNVVLIFFYKNSWFVWIHEDLFCRLLNRSARSVSLASSIVALLLSPGSLTALLFALCVIARERLPKRDREKQLFKICCKSMLCKSNYIGQIGWKTLYFMRIPPLDKADNTDDVVAVTVTGEFLPPVVVTVGFFPSVAVWLLPAESKNWPIEEFCVLINLSIHRKWINMYTSKSQLAFIFAW